MAVIEREQETQVQHADGGIPPGSPSTPERRRWQRRWAAIGIGVVGLIVGIGAGAATGGKTTTHITSRTVVSVRTKTVPVTRTVHVTRFRTRTVNHTTTVTHTVTAAAPSAPVAAGGGSSGSLSWSGNGGKTIGTITVPTNSTLHWTDDSGLFTVQDSTDTIFVDSQGASGTTAVPAGTYHAVTIIASGNWTIKIVPGG